MEILLADRDAKGFFFEMGLSSCCLVRVINMDISKQIGGVFHLVLI